MHRLLAFLICVLSCGCSDQSDRAPMLTLKIEGENDEMHSIGRFRTSSTGMLSEDGESGDDGQWSSQRVTLTEIAENGVTITFEMSDDSGADFTKEVFVGYERETKVELPNKSTLVATLKADE